MTESWKIIPVDNERFKRVDHGNEYQFTYADVIHEYDYFRGYLPKKSDQEVSLNNIFDVYERVTTFDYGKRDPLTSILDLNGDEVSWDEITNWNYAPPPPDDDEKKQLQKDIDTLLEINEEKDAELKEMINAAELQQLYVQRKCDTKIDEEAEDDGKDKSDADKLMKQIENAESIEELNRIKQTVRQQRTISGAMLSNLMIALNDKEKSLEKSQKIDERLTRRQKLMAKRRARRGDE